MRGGLVALGVIFVILGVAWFLPVMFGSAFGIAGALAAFCFWVVLAPIFIIIGIALFIVGLVAESPQQRPVGSPEYWPPVAYYPAPTAPAPSTKSAHMFCPTCGAQYSMESKVCSKDGTALKELQ